MNNLKLTMNNFNPPSNFQYGIYNPNPNLHGQQYRISYAPRGDFGEGHPVVITLLEILGDAMVMEEEEVEEETNKDEVKGINSRDLTLRSISIVMAFAPTPASFVRTH